MRLSINTAIATEVAERWRKQYQSEDGAGKKTYAGDAGDAGAVHGRILAAGDNPAKIAEAIGNKGWSYLCCSGCSDYVLMLASFEDNGDEFGLCRACMAAGSAAINACADAMERL